MKRICILLAVCFGLCLSFIPNKTTYAVGNPYVVLENDVWLLDEETDKKLFLLPKTYYAPLVGMDEKYYIVVFNGVCGKVVRAEVETTGYKGEGIGTIQTLRISSIYASFSALRMRSSPDIPENEESFQIPVNESFTYLGSYPLGEDMWYYVSYGENKGYIRSGVCEKEVVISPFEPIKEKEENSDDEHTQGLKEEPINEEESNLVKVLIVGGVGVVIVVILIVILVPKKGKHRNRYYYENE